MFLKAPHRPPANPQRLPRRFYKTASVLAAEPPFSIRLDGKPFAPRRRSLLHVPTQALAEAVAAEWEAQGRQDRSRRDAADQARQYRHRSGGPHRERIIDEIVKYAGSDLVCYRAEGPAGLVDRQADAWDAVLAWAEDSLRAAFSVTKALYSPISRPTALAAVDGILKACPNGRWRRIYDHDDTHRFGAPRDDGWRRSHRRRTGLAGGPCR